MKGKGAVDPQISQRAVGYLEQLANIFIFEPFLLHEALGFG